jgi:catalase
MYGNRVETGGSSTVPATLGTSGKLARLAGIGAVLLAIVAGFAYLHGWLTPGALTPARFVDEFQRVDGVHPGFRRNHAKGVCVSGYFESNGAGESLSRASVFRAGRVAVIGRFSLSGGNPDISDKPDVVRGLGLVFYLPGNEEWRTAMINLPVFPFNTPKAFYDHMVAAEPDATTGKPDPAKLKAFVGSHPATARAITIIKSQPPSTGFANSTFRSLNAFWFTNRDGEKIPVRWMFTPVDSFQAAGKGIAPPDDKNYLFDALIARMHEGPVQFHLIIILGQAGDPTDDATLPWPADRQQVDAGTLTLDQIESEETSPARDLNFDPLVLPVGMAPSDDPLLSARSAVYSQSFTRRAGETKSPSAVTPAEVSKTP